MIYTKRFSLAQGIINDLNSLRISADETLS